MKNGMMKMLGIVVAVLLMASGVQAATVNMTANDSGSVYSFINAGNWSDGLAPAAGNAYVSTGYLIQYGGTVPSGGYTFKGDSLTLQGGARFYSTLETIGGGRWLTISNLTLDNGTLSHNRGGGNPITMTGAMTILSGGGAMYTDSDSITWAGTITGSGTFSATKGTVILSGNNSGFSGNTSVTAGTLRFNAANSVGGSGRTITVSNGATVGLGFALDNAFLNRLVENSNTYTISLGVASSNNLDFSSSTGANISGASLGAHANVSYTGTLTPGSAGYRLGGGGSTLTFNPASFTSGQNLTLFTGGSTGTVNFSAASRTFGAVSFEGGTTTSGTLTGTSFSGTSGTADVVLAGTGAALTKTGSGTLILSKTNSYDGGTTISGGTLQLGSGSAGGNGVVVGNISNGGTLAFNNADAQTYSGNITGTGALTKSGSGTLTLSGSNSYAGNTTLNAGVTLFSSTGAIGGGTGRNITVASGATLAVGFAIDNALMQRIVANGNTSTIALGADSSNDLTFNSTTGSALTGASLGAVGTATYTGTLTPNGTTYRLGGGGGTLTFNPASFTSGNTLLLFGGGRTGTLDFGSATRSFGTVTAEGGTTIVGSGGSFTAGSSSSNNLDIGLNGRSATLNASAASTFNATVGRVYIGLSSGTSNNSTGTLNLGASNTFTVSTMFQVAGGVSGSTSQNNNGTVTTAAASATTIHTPALNIAYAVGNGTTSGTGSFTVGSSGTLNLDGVVTGNASGRTALQIAIGVGQYSPGATGTLDLSGGAASLTLSSLVMGTRSGNGTSTGNLTFGSSALNHLDISGAGTVVKIASYSDNGSNKNGTGNGTITIGNLDATSSITSTDNSTAILLANKSGTGNTTGTINFNGGTLTITTTGAAIAGGGGTSRLYLDGGATLKAGASSSNWINGLTTAEIKSGGAKIDTNGNDIGFSQGFTGEGGLIKAGSGKLTISTAQSYLGTTSVEAGVLELTDTGTLAGALTVESGGTLGGTGSIAGGLHFAAGGKLLFNSATFENTTEALAVEVALIGDYDITFDGFSVASLVGLNETFAEGTYTLITGRVDFTNVSNVGAANAAPIGDGSRSAYFQDGSLQLVIIPEPATLGLMGVVGIAMLLRRRIVRG